MNLGVKSPVDDDSTGLVRSAADAMNEKKHEPTVSTGLVVHRGNRLLNGFDENSQTVR